VVYIFIYTAQNQFVFNTLVIILFIGVIIFIHRKLRRVGKTYLQTYLSLLLRCFRLKEWRKTLRERELDSRDFHQTYTRSGNKEKNQWEKKINRHIQ
jgi:hypothetical protein